MQFVHVVDITLNAGTVTCALILYSSEKYAIPRDKYGWSYLSRLQIISD